VRQLAAFHTQGNTASFFWHPQGSTTTSRVVTHAGIDGQSFLPRLNGNLAQPASGTFTPGAGVTTFGFKIDPEWSDPARNNKTNDDCGEPRDETTCGHHLRVWPAEDRAGVPIPNTYLVTMDYAGINYDFNDNVYLVANIVPASAPADTTAPAAPADLTAAGSATGVALDWADSTEADLEGYVVERATSATGTYTRISGTSPISASAYTDAAAPAGATSYYRVRAVDFSGNASAPAEASAAVPGAARPTIRINAGGPAQTVGGVTWSGCATATTCSGWVTGGNPYAKSPVPTVTGVQAPANQNIYQNEWTGGRNSGIPAGGTAFTFNVPVPNGDYDVRLHWSENNQTAAGKRVFDVNVEGGAKELTSFDVFQQAGGQYKALVRTIPATVTDGAMTIAFIAQVENAKIDGIEILPRTAAPAANTFSYASIAAQPFSVSEAQGKVVNGQLYTFGGFDSTKSCCTPTSRAYRYDPGANTWTALAAMPAMNSTTHGGVTHAGIATDGTDVFLAGGYTSNAAGTGQIFGTREVWRYNVAANTYTRLADLPVARAGGQLEHLNGRLHFFGGTNQARTADVGDHYVLDLAGGATTWTTAAALPNPRHHMGSAVLGGRIYAVGGQHGHDGALTTQADVHTYDPATNTWTAVAALPRARGHIANSTFVLGGRIVVAGGETAHGSGIADVSAYDPATNTWTALTPLPAGRVSGVAGPNGNGFVFTSGGTAAGWRATPGA